MPQELTTPKICYLVPLRHMLVSGDKFDLALSVRVSDEGELDVDGLVPVLQPESFYNLTKLSTAVLCGVP